MLTIICPLWTYRCEIHPPLSQRAFILEILSPFQRLSNYKPSINQRFRAEPRKHSGHFYKKRLSGGGNLQTYRRNHRKNVSPHFVRQFLIRKRARPSTKSRSAARAVSLTLTPAIVHAHSRLSHFPFIHRTLATHSPDGHQWGESELTFPGLHYVARRGTHRCSTQPPWEEAAAAMIQPMRNAIGIQWMDTRSKRASNKDVKKDVTRRPPLRRMSLARSLCSLKAPQWLNERPLLTMPASGVALLSLPLSFALS